MHGLRIGRCKTLRQTKDNLEWGYRNRLSDPTTM